jgi:competence protein ComEC
VPIGELWDNGQADSERALGGSASEAARLLSLARARGARVLGPSRLCGHPRRAGGATIEVLWPCPHHDPGYDPNDNSLVVHIAYGGRSLLFAGDAETQAEQALVARGGLPRVDVLKVGHHGSRTSSTTAFLRALAPKLAIVSAGASNRFGHPHPEVIARLRAAGATPIVLADDGGTTVATDGSELGVHTWKGRKLLLPSR